MDVLKTILNSKAVDIIRTVIVVIFSFLILLTVLLQIPWVQNRIAQEAISRIKENKDINASLDKISIVLPNAVRLKGVYLGDRQNDTIFAADQLSVRISLFSLLWRKANIRWVELEGVKAHLSRVAGDSAFNFSYVPEAFNSGEPKDTANIEKKPFYLFLRQLQLTDIDFEFTDSLNQSYMRLKLDDLNVRNDSFSIIESKVVVQDIALKGMDLSYRSAGEKSTQTTENSSAFEIGLNDDIELQDINITMDLPDQKMIITNKKLSLEANSFSLQNQLADISSLDVQALSFTMIQKMADKDKEQNVTTESKLWSVKVEDFELKEGAFTLSMPDTGQTAESSQPFYLNPKLTAIDLKASDIVYNENTMAATLNEFSFHDLSGFSVEQLTTDFSFSNTQLTMEHFELVTPRSEIKAAFSATYPTKQYFSDSLSRIPLSIKITPSVLSVYDLGSLIPGFSEVYFIKDTAIQNVKLEAEASGTINSLNITRLNFDADKLTSAKLKGKISGLPSMENLWFNLTLDSLTSKEQHYLSLLPDSTLPAGISYPERLALSAKLNGKIQDFKSIVNLKTSFGDISLNGNLTRGGSKVIGYAGNVIAEQVHLGEFINNPDTLGRVNFVQDVVFALDTVTGTYLKTSLHDATIEALGYTYHSITADAVFENKELQANLAINDSNFRMTFEGNILLTDTLPSVRSTLDLTGINLQALNITDDDIRVGTLLKTDITGLDPVTMNGFALLTDLILIKNGKTYSTDTVNILVNNTTELTEASINSEVLSASYTGSVKFDELAGIFKNALFQHVNDSLAQPDLADNKKFDFQLEILPSSLIRDVLLPEINAMEPVSVNAAYSSADNQLTAWVYLPYISYQDIMIDSFELNLNLTSDSVFFVMGLQNAVSPPFSLNELSLRGNVMDKQGKLEFLSLDLEQAEKYVINSTVRFLTRDSLSFRFDNRKLILNYKEFVLPESHAVIFSDKGVNFLDFTLQSGNQSLTVTNQKLEATNTAGFNITFGDFQIENLFSLVQRQKGWVRGIVDGRLLLSSVENIPVFESDIGITDIQLMQKHAFDSMRIKADNLRENTITVDGGFFNNTNSFIIYGELFDLQTEEPQMVINTNFNNFNLSSLEPLLKDQFNQVKAIISGAIELHGPLSSPDFNGALTFNEANITLAGFRSTFIFNDQTILFNKRDVELNQFTFTDAQNNQARINGVVGLKDYSIPTMDLNIQATNFNLFNIKQSMPQNFYGKVVVDFDGTIQGNVTAPKVSLKTTFREATNFTYVVPQTAKATVDEAGVVEFIQTKTDTLNSILSVSERDTLLSDQEMDLTLTANISTHPGATFSVITDPVTNEELTIRGKGNLGFNMSPASNPSLVGRYEIFDGSYTLILYDVIRKKFNIEKGSYLTWTGDILNPTANITTQYLVETSPAPLMMTGSEASQLAGYSRAMPFRVNLNIKGDLFQPEIGFDIKVPPTESNNAVRARLDQLRQNESELNKQVFALLIMNSFLPGNAGGASSTGYRLESTARASIGNVLSSQLNRFANQYLRGVNLNVDVESYANRQQEGVVGTTEVSLDLSKAFFNDRLSVQVGGNIGINEYEQRQEQTNLQSTAGDFAVEYKITPDGRLRVKGFNKTEYEDVLTGEVNRTGISLIYNKDFTSFSDLWPFGDKKSKEKK